MTSHDVVARVRRLAGQRRVGHGGTLDPPATGVLILALGRATRLLPFLPTEPKRYLAEVSFGAETDTLDASGTVTATADAAGVDEDRVRAALAGFLGPSCRSRRWCRRSRSAGSGSTRRRGAGEEVDRAPRPIVVHELELLDFTAGERPRATLEVSCSGGTYVRSLAADLGRALGSLAHLASLRRTAVGRFTERDAHTLAELEELAAGESRLTEGAGRGRARPGGGDGLHADQGVGRREAAALANGRALEPTGRPGPVAAVGPDGRLVAVVEDRDGRARPRWCWHDRARRAGPAPGLRSREPRRREPRPGPRVRRLDGLAALPAGLDGSVVTVGMFDGVHRGHRALLDRVAAEAADRGVPAAAVTFDRHPLAVLRPGSEPPLLTILDRKVELLGGPAWRSCSCSSSPRRCPGRRRGLRRPGAVRRPGRPDGGGGGELPLRPQGGRRPGAAGRARPPPRDRGRGRPPARRGRPGGVVDRVRAELAAGDVEAAAASLGRPYAVEGEVVAGDRRGGPLLGIPTANLAPTPGSPSPPTASTPATSPTTSRRGPGNPGGAPDDRGIARPAAVSVGTNPQFGTERRVEAHVLDFGGDLYGHRVAVAFAHRLRGQAVFDGPDELAAQMRADIDQARRLLSSGPDATVRTGGFSRPTP
jgi:tRNA pseudouridine55 synthase